MAVSPVESPVIERVRSLVAPIAADLELDLYDIEQRGGTLRVTLDTPPGSPGAVDLDKLALATRLVSRELDHDDPVAGPLHPRGDEPRGRAQPAAPGPLPT
jgi:ribosome maturation factor RimP